MNFKIEYTTCGESISPCEMKKGEIGFITYHSSGEYIGRPVLKGLDILILLDEGCNWSDRFVYDMKVRLLKKGEVITLTGI